MKFKDKVFLKIKREPRLSALLLIIALLAVFLRTYNYFERLYVHSDNALFAQAAIYANRNFLLPQIGPFSQSSFFTGPWWLWILNLFFFIPLGYLTPWFIMSLISLLFIWLIFWAGREIGGKPLGIIASVLAAISQAQIDNSFWVWNAAIDPFFALLAVFFLIRFHKYKRGLDLFLLGFIVSLATTIHFQTFLLIPTVLAALISVRLAPKNFFFILSGLLIPFLPFLIFDLKFNWFWTKSVHIWVTVDQYTFWVPNRWLTYAGIYWPETWGHILGVNKFIGSAIITLLSFLTLYRLKNFKQYKIFYLIAISFVLEVILFRYFRGQRFVYYSFFAHPFVLLLTAWVILEIYKIKKFAGIILGLTIILFSFKSAVKNLESREITLSKINALRAEIYKSYPNSQFDIYGCIYNGALISHPLAFIMYYEGRNALGGKKIGVCYLVDKSMQWTTLTDEEVNQEGSAWLNHSTENVYKTMVEWFKTHPPAGPPRR